MRFNVMNSNVSNPTKVRVACQRCRAKRVRCDGLIPSCSNCAKAGATCVDVDARDCEALLIPEQCVTGAVDGVLVVHLLQGVVGSSFTDLKLTQTKSVDPSARVNVTTDQGYY